jgi:hypothetical protein
VNYSIVLYKKKDADQDWSASCGILASGCHEIGVASVVAMKAGTDVHLNVKLSVISIGNGAVVCVTSGNDPFGIFSPGAQNTLGYGLLCKSSGIPVMFGNDRGLGFDRNFLFINHCNLLLSCLYTVDKRTVFVLKRFKHSNYYLKLEKKNLK